MNNKIERLTHDWLAPSEVFFEKIDKFGGWPLKAKSVVMKHGTERDCYFSELEDVRDEWNTSVCTADDYYRWKLSPKAVEEIKKEGRLEVIRAVQNMR